MLVNSFFDTAIFYDAGKVTARRSDLDLEGLKSDYGIGFRIHGPAATPHPHRARQEQRRARHRLFLQSRVLKS